MESITYVLIVLACLVLSAFFSSSETALLRIREHELEQDIREARGPAAVAVRDLLNSTSRLLVTILLGNNVVNVMGAAVASALAVRYLGEGEGIVVATVAMTILLFVFCEVIPKTVAARFPQRVGYGVALPLYLLHQTLRPLHIAYDRLVEPLLKSISRSESAPMSTAEEVMRLARSMRKGTGKAGPIAIINAAAHAADMTVFDIMIPRTEIVAFPVETNPSELLEEVLKERYTRVLIDEGSIDHVLGLVHLKDLIQFVRQGGTDLREILKPVLRIPERREILPLLADMQRSFVHMAVVKNEFGVTLGMVTQEDILEELVGEIRDEFDREELLMIREMEPGRYQALGRVKVLDFNRETGLDVTAERGDTLAGLLFNTLGHAPRRGESVSIQGFEIIAADVSGNRITQVQVISRPEDHKEMPDTE